MRVCLDIEMQDHIVCILGGGQVALRKAKKFLSAGAKVYLCSLKYLPEWKDLNVTILTYSELMKLLPNATLAIACTDDVFANKMFIQEAKKHHVLTMSCHSEQDQDTYAMVESRNEDLVLACHTKGAFPAANRAILNDWNTSLQLLKAIRERLKNRQLSPVLLKLNREHLQFLYECIDLPGLVYLLHGGSSFRARLQCCILQEKAKKNFSNYAIGTFFLSKRHQDVSLEEFCELLQDLQCKVHFVFLFWEWGNYVKKGKEVLNSYSFSSQVLHFDPSCYVKTNENLIMHTNKKASTKNSVVVSMLDSSFLRKQYPDSRFVSCLEDEKTLERIVYETHPAF